MLSLGSLPNSRRQIEPELLRIIMQNWRLDDLLSAQSHNTKLAEGLKLIQPRATTGSLAAYDNFEFAELSKFRQTYHFKIEDTITGVEILPGEMLPPEKINVSLPDNIYNILVQYYNSAYELEFVSIAKASQIRSNRSGRNRRIVVRPQINQFGRIRIGSEIFGSAITPRYLKNSFILANFIQENNIVELYPGQVQYFFEHEVNLPTGKQIHRLAYVRWFLHTPSHQTRFHFQVDDNDIKSCNIEIWRKEFFEISRDCIIPVHNIFSRFIPNKYEIGKRKPVTYMAVIPIGRRFHM